MTLRLPMPPAIGAIVYGPDQPPETLLADFAAQLAQRGFRVGGLLQETRLGDDGCKCRMEVTELDTGRRLSLSQELGSGSNSCSLDPAALADASGALRRAVAAGVDLVFVNKFSKAEKAGHGLSAEMLDAMAAGVPLLTAIPGVFVEDWVRFTGGRGQLLMPTAEALWRWWGPERLYDDLILGLGDDMARRVVVGKRWVMVEGPHGTGLAANPTEAAQDRHWSGSLRELAAQARSWEPLAAAVGIAAINACYNRYDRVAEDGNGLEALDCDAAATVVVGAFPGLADRLPGAQVVERHPAAGQFPAEAAQWLLPRAEGVLITASALANRSLPGLLRASAHVPAVLVGPGTPLAPRLFDYGLAALAGLIVTDPDGMARAVAAGGGARDFKPFGRQAILRRPLY
jgi:uncharacterized protein (DUF4213/DUF364 family)